MSVIKDSKLDRRLARLSFQRASAASVRLLCFATTSAISHCEQETFVKEIAEELAHNDFVELAISARRLAECSGNHKIAKSISVKLLFPLQTTPTRWKFFELPDSLPEDLGRHQLNLWELFGRIIHSREFRIISDDFQIKSLVGKAGEDILEMLNDAQFSEKFQPVLFMSTDKFPLLFVSLETAARATIDYLSEMIEILSEEHDLFLDMQET
jgi:hypothetical protein